MGSVGKGCTFVMHTFNPPKLVDVCTTLEMFHHGNAFLILVSAEGGVIQKAVLELSTMLD
jgi:hypothetical protein